MPNSARVGALLAVAVIAFAGTARAQTVVVRELEGDARGALRDRLLRHLRDAGLDASPDGSADVVVEGRASRRSLSLTIGGETRRVAGRNVRQLAARGARVVLASISARSEDEPTPEPRAEHERPRGSPFQRFGARRDEVEPPPADPAAFFDAPRALAIDAGFALFSRRLGFQDDLYSRRADYQVIGAPRVQASLRWFPLRHFSSELWAHAGFAARVQRAFGVDSTSEQTGGRIGTISDGWSLDLIYELPIERHAVSASLGYGEERYVVEDPPLGPGVTARSRFTSVAYRYVRPAISGSIRIVDLLRVEAVAGWRVPTSTGGLDQSHGLPPSSSQGFDLALGFAVPLTWYLEIALRAEYHRYFFSFSPTPADYYVIGGAMDEWASLSLDVAFTLPGTAP
jgi:hypothetical protein